jgi:hypothetical protein
MLRDSQLTCWGYTPNITPMPKINVYLPDELAAAVRDAQIPVSSVCQVALERAVRDVGAMRAADAPTAPELSTGPFTRFTPRARKALELAKDATRERSQAHVETEHLLLGVIDEGGNLALKVLAALDVEPADVRSELVASLPAGEATAGGGDASFGPLAKAVLEETTKEALRLGHNYVGCEHLLLGLIATEDGLASQVLRRMGVELRTTRQAVVNALVGMIHAREQGAPAKPPTPDTTLQEILRRLEALESRLAD